MSNSSWWQHIVPGVTQAVRSATPALLSITSAITGDFHSRGVRSQFDRFSDTFDPVEDPKLLSDLLAGVTDCDGIYATLNQPNQEIFSYGEEGKPDCVVYYKTNRPTNSHMQECGTVWVVIRGTETLDDMITDLDWVTKTVDMEQLLSPGDTFDFPQSIATKSKVIIQKLIYYLESLDYVDSFESRIVKRICFTGHSLGGAMAIACHVMYNAMRQKLLIEHSIHTGFDHSKYEYPYPESMTITLGSPLLFHTPDVDLTTCPCHQYAHQVHNIIFQMDPVPRLLGPHELPSYLQTLTSLETVIRVFHDLTLVDRTHYQLYGHYYLLLQDSKETDKPAEFYHLHTQQSIYNILGSFPINSLSFMYAYVNDHLTLNPLNSLKTYVESKAMNQYMSR